MTSGPNTADGDGRGHGTFVAGILAGRAEGHAGAAPGTKLVSVDVLNDDGAGKLSDVIAGCPVDPRPQGPVRDPRRQLLAERRQRRVVPLGSARQGRREAVVQRHRRRGRRGQLRHRRRREPRQVRTRERPVRDHRRRERHELDAGRRRRLRGSLVGLGLHVRRVPEARHRGPRPRDGRPRARERRSAPGAPGARDDRRPHVAVGNVDGSSRRRRRGRRDPRAASVLDAGSGQGRAAVDRRAAGRLHSRRLARARRPPGRRRGRLGRAAQPERGPRPVRHARPRDRRSDLRRDHVGRGRRDERQLGQRLLDSASWDSASWDSASWDSASWDSASWDSASWDSASWDSASWESSTWLR